MSRIILDQLVGRPVQAEQILCADNHAIDPDDDDFASFLPVALVLVRMVLGLIALA